ncbi:MAG TPA: hypothetical protein VHF45_08625, partial [Thermoleophilaceae bacterium]|nr:hypothetical protein [Thermoleophilaceae bacterium]
MIGHDATPTRWPGVRLLLGVLARPERHRYGDARSQRADLYVPRGDGPFPVAVLLHGGYWRSRYGKSLMRAVAA